MSIDLYNKNLQKLKNKYTQMYERLLQYKTDEERIVVDESYNGEKIIAVKHRERLYYLNSRYNDEEFSKNWINGYDDIKYQELFLIFGLSNFNCIKKLSNKVGDNNLIMLYEPDIEIFYNTIQFIDITEILNKDNVLLCIKGVNDVIFDEFLIFAMNYSNLRLLDYICMPNYSLLYMDEWKRLIEKIKEHYAGVIANRNTYLEYSGEFINNELDNCEDMMNQYSLNQLREEFLIGNKTEKMTAFIVAAGPSLEKNILELKKIKDKAYIIAVDTALTALLNNNIKPDFVVTIDAHKPPILFTHKDFFDIPLVVCEISNSKLRHIHEGKRIYFNAGSKYFSGVYKRIRNEEMQVLETGGSVSNNAFSLANVLGVDNIILVGQDLAYPNNKCHIADAYLGTEKEINNNSDNYIEVEDIFGEKVITEKSMNLYRVWFEQQIERYPHLNVIDATEGGAKIRGAKILTLREAIDNECIENVDKNIVENIKKINYIKLGREYTHDVLGENLDLDKMKNKIETGIRKYEKLFELFRKNKIKSKEFKTIMSEIDEIVKEIEKEPIMYLISLYNKSDEYEVLGVVNDVKNDLEEEISEVVKNGIKVLTSYKNGIKSLKEDLKKRKEFDIEKYEETLLKINNNVIEIDKENAQGEYLNINNLMKIFMILALRMMDLLYKVNANNYQKSVSVLKRIIVEFTDKKYDNMINIMKKEFIEVVSDLSR